MSAVKQLHEMTTEFFQLTTKRTEQNDRDQLLGDIMKYLDTREELIKKVKSPYTDEETRLGKEIVSMDEQIQASLQDILTQLKGSMKQVQNQKRNNTKYMNPYQNVSTVDGMFFDKRN
ncbi:hypothetical protein [Salinibacillus xinjiangensis]|uniref:Flagellar protein FliT n=1 Tax=Salinibacillus xinjiangensis TaxID=1229268 RepID=A0A6G1X1E7_9BACI|nr:hypothetical protein [Salinibacillus xinjiangensis]MRG84772.1 hypothetical protein [Salinibacillus xinjiangensis]